jgi:hypothetical protein
MQGFLFVILGKMILSALVPFISRRRPALVESLPLVPYRKPEGNLSTWRGVRRDLTRPLFLFSFALFIVYLAFTETTRSGLVLKALRPLAIGILFFWLSRSPWTTRIIGKLRERARFAGFFRLADLTIAKMREKTREP